MPPKPPTPRLTRFLALQLVTQSSKPQLHNSLRTFRESCLQAKSEEFPDGIPEKGVRPLGTLHLTLGVMSLVGEERVKGAMELLKELNLKDVLSGAISDTENVEGEDGGGKDSSEKYTLNITLQGLNSMQNPNKTSVLYASPLDPLNHVQKFCSELRRVFTEAKFLVADSRPLLLHATILNTVYVNGKGKGGKGPGKGKLLIDARELVQDFKDMVWMKDVRVEKVAVCRMGAEKGQNGEESYVVEGEVELP